MGDITILDSNDVKDEKKDKKKEEKKDEKKDDSDDLGDLDLGDLDLGDSDKKDSDKKEKKDDSDVTEITDDKKGTDPITPQLSNDEMEKLIAEKTLLWKEMTTEELLEQLVKESLKDEFDKSAPYTFTDSILEEDIKYIVQKEKNRLEKMNTTYRIDEEKIEEYTRKHVYDTVMSYFSGRLDKPIYNRRIIAMIAELQTRFNGKVAAQHSDILYELAKRFRVKSNKRAVNTISNYYKL